MTSRVRSPDSVSFSSTGRVSFSGSVRLSDFATDGQGDEYGFGTGDDIEEAVEARESSAAPNSIGPVENADLTGTEMSDTDSITQDRSSLGSNDSKDQSKISALIDKARLKGKQLVSRRERKSPPRSEEIEESSPLLTGCSDSPIDSTLENETLVDIQKTQPSEIIPKEGEEEKEPIPITIDSLAKRCRSMPFFRHRMYCLGVLIALTLIIPGFLTGLLWGLYVSFSGFLYLFVSDPGRATRSVQAARKRTSPSEDVDLALEANLDDEGTALGMKDHIVYRGWMNELRTRYSPGCYHVNNAQTVLVRLEGSTLRISRPAKAGLKHAFHQDPTLQQSSPSMVSQSIYDLMHAKVSLRPKRLAKRRWWSRKYPIHIRFPHKSGALAEVDIEKPGMSRSISLHPVAGSREDKPTVSEIRPVDENGYSAESETSSDDEVNQGVQRSNSAGDLVEYKLEPSKLKRGKGRSIYLFVRAAREKERWFHLLREACVKPVPDLNDSKNRRSSVVDEFKRSISEGFDSEGLDGESTVDSALTSLGKSFEYALYRRNHRQFAQEMLRILGNGIPCPEKDSTVSIDLGDMKWQPGIIEENSDLVESINALGARIFFDFSRDKFWENAVKQKIQSKLATIHLPYFIETLSLSELDLGGAAPRIVGVYAPKMNEWGLWVDFEMKYKGRIRLVLQTSVNLLKLQNGHTSVETERKVSRWTDSVRATHYSDEDLPESPESSPDEDFGAKNQSDGNRERTGRKILSIVEKAAQSKFFQKAAKHPRVAKFMEEMSSTPLILNVEIEQLEGTMTINIPPPPSDRLWHGFRNVPTVSIRAIPQVGDRSVDFSTVSDWIESKLRLLIEKNLVSPNMDDIVLPVMSGNSLLHFGYNK
ncbi:unnamed protein product [Auanema sp. JU1783]|nr:unnamed protein product [Auanema sp. JU1783]